MVQTRDLEARAFELAAGVERPEAAGEHVAALQQSGELVALEGGWWTARELRELIERTAGRIGDRVAEVTLVPDRGVCVAKTGGPLHWSVWGRPAELQAAVAGYRYPG